MQRLLLIGLNHTTAPLEVREKVAFSREQARAALRSLREKFPDAEIALLSACSRVELSISRGVHGHPRAEQLADILAEFHAIDAGQLTAQSNEKEGRYPV